MAYPARILFFLALSATAPAVAQTVPPVVSATERVEARVYTYVEQMPTFHGGGPDSIVAYLSRTIRYPAEALARRIEGRVFVTFVVGATGAVEQASVLKGAHSLLDAEALRVVQLMPAWEPGRQTSRAVRVSYTLPITFRLPAAPAPAAPLLTGPRPAATGRPPYLQGGQQALADYLKAAPYPEEARQAQASGVVFVTVAVDAKGQVTKVGSSAGIGLQNGQRTPILPALRFAALNLLSNGPAWVPGQLKGKAVAATTVVPLQFDAASGTVSVVPGLRLFPEVPPTAPDGPEALLKQTAQRLRYPPAALRSQQQGKVVLFLQVSEEGRLERPQVIESVSPELGCRGAAGSGPAAGRFSGAGAQPAGA